jgi:hypothetical protein
LDANPGSLRYPGSLWLQAHPRSAASYGFADHRQDIYRPYRLKACRCVTSRRTDGSSPSCARIAVAEFGNLQRIGLVSRSQPTSKVVGISAHAKGVVPDFSSCGKSTDSAFSETFKGRSRLECLNQLWFLDIEDARARIEAWRQDYKTVRPHCAIGNPAPMDLMRKESDVLRLK